ncbi:MAG TPA: hypothetical protein VI959_03200 [Alphaproteobacteria bacterium]|nr:hypothetical protein [Alphaproteobacteria bacterium]
MTLKTILWLDPNSLSCLLQLKENKIVYEKRLPLQELEKEKIEGDVHVFCNNPDTTIERLGEKTHFLKRLKLSFELWVFSYILKTYSSKNSFFVKSFITNSLEKPDGWKSFESVLKVLKEQKFQILDVKDVSLLLYEFLQRKHPYHIFYSSFWNPIKGAYFISFDKDYSVRLKRYLFATTVEQFEKEKAATGVHLQHTLGVKEKNLTSKEIDFQEFIKFGISYKGACLYPPFLEFYRIKKCINNFYELHKTKWILSLGVLAFSIGFYAYTITKEINRLVKEQTHYVVSSSNEGLKRKKLLFETVLNTSSQVQKTFVFLKTLEEGLLKEELLLDFKTDYKDSSFLFTCLSKEALDQKRLKIFKNFLKERGYKVCKTKLTSQHEATIEIKS